ncbi:MAG TPA: flagellar basal body rod protein FlgC [Methylovirgula sp.]
MIDPIDAAIQVATSGLEAQSTRLRVVAENLANANSTSSVAGGDPYSRKTVTFEDEMDRTAGVDLVHVKDVGTDTTPFKVEYDPSNPAADTHGFVKMPNVNLIAEMADMREANRSYTADLEVVKQGRQLYTMTIDLLRNSA